MFACSRFRVRCTSRYVEQSVSRSFNPSVNPVITQSVRFFQPLFNSGESRTPFNPSHSRSSDTNDRAPETAVRQSRRQKKIENERARVQEIKKMSFSVYNRELSNRVKKYEDWRGLLLFLSQEMDNTKYNKLSSQFYTNPNKKHEQWTGATIADIINRLIKLRKTRKEVLDDDDSMLTLNRLCVIIESSVPRLHDELDIWKHLFHPYLYLRECVDEWNVNRIAKRKVAMTAAREAQLRQNEARESSKVASDVELKLRMKELNAKNAQLRKSMPAKADEADDEPDEHHLSWMFKKDDENEIDVESQPTKAPQANLRGEPESVKDIVRRVTQKDKPSQKTPFTLKTQLNPRNPRLWVSPAEKTLRASAPLEAEIVDEDESVEEVIVEEKPGKVKKFFGRNADVDHVDTSSTKKKVKKFFGQ